MLTEEQLREIEARCEVESCAGTTVDYGPVHAAVEPVLGQRVWLVNVVLSVDGAGRKYLSVMTPGPDEDHAVGVAVQLLNESLEGRAWSVLHAWCNELSVEYLERLLARVRADRALEAELLGPWVRSLVGGDGG